MLLWQQNNLRLRNKYRVVAHIMWCLICMHALVLLAIFCVSARRKPIPLTITRAVSDIPVYFYKAPATTTARVAAPRKQVPAKKQQAAKRQPPKKTAAPAKKAVPAVSTVAEETKNKRNTDEAKKEPIAQKKAAPQEELAQSASSSESQQPQLTAQEREIMIIQQCVVQQIAPHFKVPPGLAKDIFCEVIITVDAHGKLVSHAILKPSSSLLFDMAVEQALSHVEQLPLWAAGKQFSITFN